MIYKNVPIVSSNLDSHGDMIDLSGVIIPSKLIVTESFDLNKPIGTAVNFIKEIDRITCDIETSTPISLLTTSIAYIPIDYSVENGITHIHEMKLMGVSLSVNPNADDTIKPLNQRT